MKQRRKTFVNPITGEKTVFDVQVKIPDNIEESGCIIDVHNIVEHEVRFKLDEQIETFTIDAIVKYAHDNNKARIKQFIDCSNGMLMSNRMIYDLYYFIYDSKSPVIYTNDLIYTLLKRFGRIEIIDEKENVDEVCRKVTIKDFTYHDVLDPVRQIILKVVKTWPFDKTEIVAYDLDNAKNCTHLIYGNE